MAGHTLMSCGYGFVSALPDHDGAWRRRAPLPALPKGRGVDAGGPELALKQRIRRCCFQLLQYVPQDMDRPPRARRVRRHARARQRRFDGTLKHLRRARHCPFEKTHARRRGQIVPTHSARMRTSRESGTRSALCIPPLVPFAVASCCCHRLYSVKSGAAWSIHWIRPPVGPRGTTA